MAFPQVANQTAGTQSTNSNSWSTDVTVPAHNSGELLMLFIGVDGTPTVTPTSINGVAWTTLVDHPTAGVAKLWVGYLFATSNQATPLAFTINLNNSEQGRWRVPRITGAHATTPPEASISNGVSGQPTSPVLNPVNWDVEDTLWYTLAGGDDGNTALTSIPADYTDQFGDASGGGNGAWLFGGRRELAAASEDPGIFQLDRTTEWSAATVAVRPAAAAAGVGMTIPRRASRGALLQL